MSTIGHHACNLVCVCVCVCERERAPLSITHTIDFGAGDVDVVVLDDLVAAGKVLENLLQQLPVRIVILSFVHSFKDMNSG